VIFTAFIFTSASKKGVLRIFIAVKNPSPRPGLIPRTFANSLLHHRGDFCSRYNKYFVRTYAYFKSDKYDINTNIWKKKLLCCLNETVTVACCHVYTKQAVFLAIPPFLTKYPPPLCRRHVSTHTIRKLPARGGSHVRYCDYSDARMTAEIAFQRDRPLFISHGDI
jgi:hypothetical protein